LTQKHGEGIQWEGQLCHQGHTCNEILEVGMAWERGWGTFLLGTVSKQYVLQVGLGSGLCRDDNNSTH